MSGRNAFATPTNVTPRNGQPVVFNADDKFLISFTNNADAVAFVRYKIFDAVTNEEVRNWYCRWFNSDTFSVTSNRGDTYNFGFDREKVFSDDKDFIIGRHYKYAITLYCCYPAERGGSYTLQPNCSVNFASGEIYSVVSDTKFTIADRIKKIELPTYWGEGHVTYYPNVGDNIISCCTMRMGYEERMITSYNSSTGEVEIFEPFSETTVAAGTQYQLYCNYISTTGSESEGTYDFYLRDEIKQETNAYPVPWGLQCESTYSHPNRIGLENYRFKVYSTQNDNYLTGNIRSVSEQSDGNTEIDNQHIPIATGITENLNKKIIIFDHAAGSSVDKVESGERGEIISYDASTGIAVLKTALTRMPVATSSYTVYLDSDTLLADSGDCYSYHLNYNFPLYVFGKSLRVETILTTYEKQRLSSSITVDIAEPERTFDYGQLSDDYEITTGYSGSNAHTVFLRFRRRLSDIGDYMIFRKEHGTSIWNYLGFINSSYYYIDYLAANNTVYDYMISRAVLNRNSEYDASKCYKAAVFDRAVTTDWDGWTITAIYPCENKYLPNTIENMKQSGSQNSTKNMMTAIKKPYEVGDTWTFISDIDSGSITMNTNRTVHVGTSRYPIVTSTNNRYNSGSFTANLLSLSCPSGEIVDDIQRVKKWNDFINDDCLFILKSDKGDVWIIAITDNTSHEYDESMIPILTKISYSWTEVESADNIQIIEHY